MPEDCVILDLPEGLRLNLLGLIVQIDRILIRADRAGLFMRPFGVAHMRRRGVS